MMNGKSKKMPKTPILDRKGRRDDEDLVLFRELSNREKDRVASLLQPVSDEFEPNAGNYALYRIGSRKKGSRLELFGENEKNDYDWLKTPPATPLFPSIEMEANGTPELVVQHEMPVLQSLSRFAGNSAAEATKESTGQRPKSPKPRPKVPMRSITPSQIRPITVSTISPIESKISTKATTTTTTTAAMTILSHKTNSLSSSSPNTNPNNTIRKPNMVLGNTRRSITTEKEDNPIDYNNFITSNFSKSMVPLNVHHTKTKPTSRGVSPATRSSTIPAQIPGFSDERPPNLRTEARSVSAAHQRPRRQSRSPSVTRDGKVDDQILKKQESDHPHQGLKGRGFGTQILGSKMVDKVISARKSSAGADDREAKAKSQATGFIGRNNNINNNIGVSKSSSLDMALKHNKEIKRDGTNFRHLGTLLGRSSARQ